MATYCRIVVHKSRQAIEAALLRAFDASQIISEAQAEPADFLLSEGSDEFALDEFQKFSFVLEPEFLIDLSQACNARVTAISVQTGVGYVGILVVDQGRVVRRYAECEGTCDLDEGELPDWDDAIRSAAESAAFDLAGIAPWTPEPPVIGPALRKLGRWIGLVSKNEPDEKPPVPPARFGEPVGAISTKRFHGLRNLQATTCRLDGARLVCTLDSGDELILRPAEVRIAFLDPFTGQGVYLALHDRRTVTLPEGGKLAEIEQWRTQPDASSHEGR